jgi:FkbM family methyltransferase
MDDAQASWKRRYGDLEARLAATKETLKQTREALARARKGEQDARDTLAKVRERLHWHERSLLRPEMTGALMPARAEWRRRTPPDPLAIARDAQHTTASSSYARACAEPAPIDADRVEIGGVGWWVPRDARAPGRLADRLVSGKHLPFVDILRTREAISNGTMIDIGANIGLTSVTRALLGDADVIYAAEPAPDNFACLVRTIVDAGLRGTVLPDCIAISDRNGSATLQLSTSIGGHALTEHADGIAVRTMTLDAWIAALAIDVECIRYVKIDAQGYESHVLAGARDVLSRRGIVWELEFSPPHLQAAGRDPAAVIAQMQAAFTHFIDLNPRAPGDRIRPATELADGLSYLGRSFTDLLLYR